MAGTKTKWKEQTSKIGWTDVPANVNKLLAILKGRYVYYMSDPEERKNTAIRQLSEQMHPDVIKAGMAWLKKHRKQYAFSSKNPRGYSRDVQYVRLNIPYTRYQRYGGNYRGITSTVVRNQFNIKRELMERWQAIVDAHWDKRTAFKDAKAFAEQQNQLNQIKGLVEDEEKYAKRVLSKDEIREGILKTFNAYRCGNTSSSHGAWSFGLTYSTRYIVSDPDRYEYKELDKEYEAGDLMDPDWPALSNKIMEMASKITDDGLRSQLPELAIRYTNAHQTQWQASKDWHEVMEDIYNKMKEMIE